MLNLTAKAAMVFAVLFVLAVSTLAPSDAHAARAGSESSQGVATLISGTWVQVSTGGNISMSVVPTPGSSLVASKSTLNVKTNSSSGYQLYIAGSLYREGDASRYAGLYLDGDTTGGANAVIAAVPDDAAHPGNASALAVNQWGYAVADTGTFSSSTLYDAAIAAQAVTNESDMNNLKWKGLTGDFRHLISSTNNAESMATLGENIDIYYGARINNTLSLGNFRNTVVYTAFVDGTDAIVMNPAVLPTFAANESAQVTFTTGHESSSQPVTKDQIEVQLFDSANASTQIATCDPASIAVVSGYDGTAGRPLKFTCNVTRNLAAGGDTAGKMYDVIVRVDSENSGTYVTYEEQDYWRFKYKWDYSLTFAGEGTLPAAQTGTKEEGQSFTYTLPTPTRSDYSFRNWSDGAAAQNAGTGVTLTESTPSKTMTANWDEISVTYTLSFNNGGQSGATGMPANKTTNKNLSAGHSASISITTADEPSLEGYIFQGWAETNGGAVVYAKGSSHSVPITWTTGTTASKTLYAVWEQDGAPAMQSFSCSTMSIGEEKILRDERDNKEYVIRKYQDGACWMAQDLDLDLYVNNCSTDNSQTGTTGTMGTCRGGTFVAFDANNTNAGAWTVSGSNKAYDTQRTEAATTAWNSNGQNGGTSNTYEVRSFDENGTAANTTAKCMKNYSTKTADGTTNISNRQDCTTKVGEANTQAIGNYYNWPAATAGSTASSGEVSTSICPKGWILPYGNTSSAKGSIGGLLMNEGVVSSVARVSMSDDIMKKVTGNTNTAKGHQLTFLRSGYYNYSSSAIANRGDDGDYWSSTASGATNAYNLSFYANNLYPGTDSSNKGYGFAVRCVAL